MNNESRHTRRNFLQSLLGMIAVSASSLAKAPAASRDGIDTAKGLLPTRPLGATGFRASVFSIGGQATLENPDKRDESIEIVNKALDLGVNYIDTAAIYGQGSSERFIGEVLKTRRNEVFLATKTDDRSYDGSMRVLEASLKRLQTDHIDLWQIHNIQTDFDTDMVLSREGAVKAIEKARQEGVVRFAGITGHRDPQVLSRAIQRYPFDVIMMALNAADPHERSFKAHLLPLAVQKNMGIVAMKVPCRGRIFNPQGVKSMSEAMRYVLTLPVSTATIGISDVHELEEDARIARDFRPYSETEMEALERSTQSYAANALWYRDHE